MLAIKPSERDGLIFKAAAALPRLLSALAARERDRDEAVRVARVHELAAGIPDDVEDQIDDALRRLLSPTTEGDIHAVVGRAMVAARKCVTSVGQERDRLRAELTELRVFNLQNFAAHGAELAARERRIAELEGEVARLLKGTHIDLAELERNQTDECWECKVGDVRRSELPYGADLPMRNAVKEAFKALVGRYPRAVFSGWGGRWSDEQLGVLYEFDRARAALAAEGPK
jgi:hypothetical protein